MANYRLSNKAVNDLQRISQYTKIKFGEHQAKRYLEGIHETVVQLSLKPEVAPATPEFGEGYKRYLFQKHAIYFKPASYGIYIVRILHQQMSQKRHFSQTEHRNGD